jgi:hypothetical protein
LFNKSPVFAPTFGVTPVSRGFHFFIPIFPMRIQHSLPPTGESLPQILALHG